ncbi:MAG TPA: type II toxin-antitoxin system VapC family toxin [Pseudonocardiaceae bacterium]|nr:type II toxin-antitoxin system VapC family toxin [Pseudonocardiaceae bacterium]
MPLLYADTSAIVGAYLSDEPDHETLNRMLLSGDDPIVTSQLSVVEFGSAMARAHRANRIAKPEDKMAEFVADCSDQGVFNVVAITSKTILPLAQKLVMDHHLGALDAVHLSTALIEAIAVSGGDNVAMVTRDERQATAAKACGLRVL